MSTTSVPWSIRSTFVKTPIVLAPSGSTSLAIFRPSELARSVLAPVTARMMALGLVMYFMSISRICRSMSRGWLPTGTFVKPGKSTRVRVRTFGEKMRKLIGRFEMPKDGSTGSASSARAFPRARATRTRLLASLQFCVAYDLVSDFIEVMELLARCKSIARQHAGQIK